MAFPLDQFLQFKSSIVVDPDQIEWLNSQDEVSFQWLLQRYLSSASGSGLMRWQVVALVAQFLTYYAENRQRVYLRLRPLEDSLRRLPVIVDPDMQAWTFIGEMS